MLLGYLKVMTYFCWVSEIYDLLFGVRFIIQAKAGGHDVLRAVW